MSLEEMSDIEHVRERPAMYIGDTGFFGMVHYLVSAVNLFLERSPSWISIEALDDRFRIQSDATIPIEAAESGELIPFEKFGKAGHSLGLNGPIVTGLSSTLNVVAQRDGRRWRLGYVDGCRTEDAESTDGSSGTTIEFAPDRIILRAPAFSSYNFDSYLHRLSFLNPGIEFSFTEGGRKRTYHSPGGIRAMFDCMAAPYQILHEPIHFRHQAGDLDLEIAWGFHSWTGNVMLSFVNRGRAVLGGTHEQGLAAAFRSLPGKVGLRASSRGGQNGVVAIMSILYPGAILEGCLKNRIGNKELRPLVRKTIVEQSLKWIDDRPAVRAQIAELGVFTFPDIWMTSK
jgi:DNA gyrase/topoisomerase IV subunit B